MNITLDTAENTFAIGHASFDVQRVTESPEVVVDGITCDVYSFTNEDESSLGDLGLIRIKEGTNTPIQLVTEGSTTFEQITQGDGLVILMRLDKETGRYERNLYWFKDGVMFFNTNSESNEVACVYPGDIMSIFAMTDLTAIELCYEPPYREQRFINLDNVLISDANILSAAAEIRSTLERLRVGREA